MVPHTPKIHRRVQAGFSLIQLSIIMAVASIALVAVLPGGQLGDEGEKKAITLQNMQRVEDATKAFMVRNLRRPCPADGSKGVADTATYGIEAATPGTCTGGTPASNFSSGNFLAGTVPFKTLGIPEEYSIDGWGRRLTYVVDKRATLETTCRDLQSHGQAGSVAIKTTSSSNAYDSVMWALIAYGKDAHGAFSLNGTSVANRFNTGNSDADTRLNAFVDASFATSFTGVLVSKAPTSTFDDMVWSNPSTKNNCCIGKACLLGFRLDSLSGTGLSDVVKMAVGDINGDGLADLVVGNYLASPDTVYIYLGTKTGWPILGSSTMLSTGIGITDTSSISNFGAAVAVGDINADGYDDVLISGTQYFTVYRGSASPANVNTSALTGSNGFILNVGASHTNAPGAVAIANIDGDTSSGREIKDMIFFQAPFYRRGWVVFGQTSWASGSYDISAISSATTPAGFYMQPPSGGQYLANGARPLAVGKVNSDDSYDDIILGDVNNLNVYVIFGQTRASWPASTYDLTTQLNTSATARLAALGSNFGNGIAVADTNDDGIQDIVVTSNSKIFGYYGRSFANWSTATSSWLLPVPMDSSASFSVAISANAASAGGTFTSSQYPYNLAMGDVNNDGKKDILIGTWSFNPTYSGSPRTGAGGLWVLYQKSDRSFPSDMFTMTLGTHGFRMDGAIGTSFNSGITSAVTGDFNGDGKTDIYVGGSSPIGGGLGPPTFAIYGRKNVAWEPIVDLNCLSDRTAAGC